MIPSSTNARHLIALSTTSHKTQTIIFILIARSSKATRCIFDWIIFFFSSLIHLWLILSLVCDWACNFFIHTTILWYRSIILLVSVFTLILYIKHIGKHITTRWLRDHGYIERKVVIVLLADHEISVFTLTLCIEHISKYITIRWLRHRDENGSDTDG